MTKIEGFKICTVYYYLISTIYYFYRAQTTKQFFCTLVELHLDLFILLNFLDILYLIFPKKDSMEPKLQNTILCALICHGLYGTNLATLTAFNENVPNRIYPFTRQPYLETVSHVPRHLTKVYGDFSLW